MMGRKLQVTAGGDLQRSSEQGWVKVAPTEVCDCRDSILARECVTSSGDLRITTYRTNNWCTNDEPMRFRHFEALTAEGERLLGGKKEACIQQPIVVPAEVEQ